MTRRGLAAAALLAGLVVTGCSSGPSEKAEPYPTPTLTGDAHILSVAEGIGATEYLSDDRVIELGHIVCDYLDESNGDFRGLDLMIANNLNDDPVTIVQVWTTAMAGVPAYCPEWTNGLIDYAESQDARQ